MPKKTYKRPPDEREAYIIENADYFVASVRLGVGGLYKVECKHADLFKALELAVDTARALAREHKKPTMIYAIKDSSHAYMATIDPPAE